MQQGFLVQYRLCKPVSYVLVIIGQLLQNMFKKVEAAKAAYSIHWFLWICFFPLSNEKMWAIEYEKKRYPCDRVPFLAFKLPYYQLLIITKLLLNSFLICFSYSTPALWILKVFVNMWEVLWLLNCKMNSSFVLVLSVTAMVSCYIFILALSCSSQCVPDSQPK